MNNERQIIAIRRPGAKIINPSRFIQMKHTNWKKIFGSFEAYVNEGDVSEEVTEEEIKLFCLKNKLRRI